MQQAYYDVAIIGAGVSGCAIARELSRLDVRACVIEAEDDVCCGTSRANSAIVHAGFDAQPGTLMARLNVEGTALMPRLCAELGVDFRPIGSLVVCTDEKTLPDLDALQERGRANGVPDLRVIGREELLDMEPNASDAAIAALWAPTAGIVNHSSSPARWPRAPPQTASSSALASEPASSRAAQTAPRGRF